jgi:hypothetical protein
MLRTSMPGERRGNTWTELSSAQPSDAVQAPWRAGSIKEVKVRRLRGISIAAASLVALSAPACGTESAPQAPSATQPQTATTGGRDTPRREISARDFDRKDFPASPKVDNEWMPLRPGTQFVYHGSTREGRKRIRHRLVVTVPGLTKVINGVPAVVGWERDYSEGELIESELVFFAQDNDGNVWHLGQYRETYDPEDEGEFVGGRVFLAGWEGARAGLMMKAAPRLGTPTYSQGYAPPPFYWADSAKVYRMGQRTCVPARCYDDVLVIDEFDRFEPGAHQLKFYARGVGNVRVGWSGANDPEKEVLVLAKVKHLSPQALAKARREALEMERRAYLYGRTPPVKRAPPGEVG